MKEIDRKTILNKFDGHCAYCGCELLYKDMQVDHLISQRNFWGDVKNKFRVPEFLKHLGEWDCNHPDNLFPSCRVCNNWKSVFDIETFRSEISKQLERLNKNHANYRFAKRYGLIQETPKPIVFYFELVKLKDNTKDN